MPRVSPAPEIKAAALADLATGEQPAAVADRYRLNAATVRSWKKRMDATDVATSPGGVATPVAPMQHPTIIAQQQAIGDLVLDNLRAKLIATQRLAEHATTPAWLDKQTAADVAELFESLDRSAVAILDRLAAARRSPGRDDADR